MKLLCNGRERKALLAALGTRADVLERRIKLYREDEALVRWAARHEAELALVREMRTAIKDGSALEADASLFMASSSGATAPTSGG